MYTVDNFINGKSNTTSKNSSIIVNPSYGKEIGKVLYATDESVNLAVDSSLKAFDAWSQTGLSYRAELILEFRQLLINKSSEIIDLCTTEAGKTLPDAEAELDRAVQCLTHAAAVQHFYPSHLSPNVAGGIDIADRRYPLGVIVGVGPFNFPILIPIVNSSMALVTGDTFISKPSEKVPSISRLIADLYKDAGFPDGCFNLLNGDKEVVESLVCHKDVSG